MRSTRRLLICGFAALLVVTGLGLWLFLRPAPTPAVATGTVTVGDVEQTVLATGKLRPKELVSVGAQVSGQVKRLYVRLGQKVRAGEVIADIDAQPQQLALKSAEAAISSLEAQKNARDAALVQAELAFRRQQTMLVADATAHADYEAARATLQSTRNEVKSFAAQIVQARTQAQTARINLAYTHIVAPMDGVVVAVVTKQGQTVNSFQSAPTIVMLARLDVMTVRAEISEADVAKVHPGQVAWFTTLGAPDKRYYARVQQIEPAPELIATEGAATTAGSGAQSGTATAIYYIAQFEVPNPAGALRTSMTAQVSVLLARVKRAVLVPAAALGPRDANGRATVRLIDAQGRLVPRAINVGIGDDSNVVVLSGLRPGEKVALAEAPASASPPADMGMGF